MKRIQVFLLLIVMSAGLLAQDSTKRGALLLDHFTLDLHGSALLIFLGTYSIPYNIHVSPGIKLTEHLALSASYSFFGAEGEYYSTQYAGFGLGLRYDRFPFILKGELMQMTRLSNQRDWDGWRLRERNAFNPMARLHLGFRVAPRFTLGLSFGHARNIRISGNGYLQETGDFTPYRSVRNHTSLQLFFGLSLGKQERES